MGVLFQRRAPEGRLGYFDNTLHTLVSNPKWASLRLMRAACRFAAISYWYTPQVRTPCEPKKATTNMGNLL